MRSHIRKPAISFLSSLTMILSWSCGNDQKYGGEIEVSTAGKNADQGVSKNNPNNDKGQSEEDLQLANIGILNFRQVAATFSKLTNVQLEGETLAEYEKQLSAFNKSNNVQTISPSTVSAVTKLAAAYCDTMLADPVLTSQKLPGIELDSDTIASHEDFAEIIIDAFYGPETILQGDRDKDIQLLIDYSMDLSNQNTTVADIAFGSCTSILASAEFYLF